MSNDQHAGSRNYYKDIVPGYEYMDVMEHTLGYEGVVEHLRGQIFKYLFRLGKKDKASSESEKISWYASRLDDTIKRHEAKNETFPKVNTLVESLLKQLEKRPPAEDPIMSVRPGKENLYNKGLVTAGARARK